MFFQFYLFFASRYNLERIIHNLLLHTYSVANSTLLWKLSVIESAYSKIGQGTRFLFAFCFPSGFFYSMILP